MVKVQPFALAVLGIAAGAAIAAFLPPTDVDRALKRFPADLPLGDRKNRLARLLGKRQIGIVLSEHADEDGATIFQEACKMGLEGIVPKRLSAPYRSGQSRDWIKVKNPNSPAMVRHREERW
jgi:hypothetical protein